MKGIGASRGIAIAKAFCLKPLVLDTSLKSVTDPHQEIIDYQACVQQAVAQITTIKQQATHLSDQAKAVFDAHIQLAQDPAMIEEVQTMIVQKRCNASHALMLVAQKYIELFKSMNDPYMAARAADIKDVYDRIIALTNGLVIPDLSLINEPVIIVAEDLSPSQTGQLNKDFVKGFATDIGSRTSHSAIMARSLEIPAVLGLKNITSLVHDGDLLAINGDSAVGEVIINPSAQEIATCQAQAQELANNQAL